MVIKNFSQFLKKEFFKINENSVTTDVLLKSIDAEQILMGDVLDVNLNDFNNIDVLYNDPIFLKNLNKKGLKKNNIEYSKDIETFLDDSINIKFFLIFKKEESELDPIPEYLIIQTKNEESKKWNTIKMYEVNDNIRNFYDKLSSKTIEIKKGDKNYIYRTSNAGNDWSLQNVQNKDDYFKMIMSNDDLKKTINLTKSSISAV